MSRELDSFLTTWDAEAQRTADVLRKLPADQYELRPDPNGRTLGQLAWHLAEIDGFIANGVARGSLSVGDRPVGIERPRTIAELAPGYERIHRTAAEQLRGMGEIDFDREIAFFDGKPMPIRRILWDAMLHHTLHHRGQLVLMCRIAGGMPPGLYGPTREETEALKAARA